MSDSQPDSASRAVFLSYASQDAEAAKRICDTLRAAGVEVWFDQSELVGGDAWDAKIRKQIADCALFVPVISANTQSRREGYFRLEWRIAAQRTHMMSEQIAFLMPVVIDTTRDAGADVPGEFKAVQWTRLPGGETTAMFCARVQKLLGGDPGTGTHEAFPPNSETLTRSATKTARRPWLVPTILGAAAVAALIIWSPWRQREQFATTATPAAPPSTRSAATTEITRLRARLIPAQWKKEDFEPWSAAVDKIIAADDQNADAWALRSILNSLLVLRNYDLGTKPLEDGRLAANRALSLAPASPLAELALGMHYGAMISRGGDRHAAQPRVRHAIAQLGHDPLTRYAEAAVAMLAFDFEELDRAAKDWLRNEPTAKFPAWLLGQTSVAQRNPQEALKWGEQIASDENITTIRAFVTIFETNYYLQADLTAARASLDRVPASARTVHRVLYSRWLLAMAERRWDTALQELARTPEAILGDREFHGPKALLAGLAHQAAGREEAAQSNYREAERVLREQLAGDPQNEELHAVLALTMACLGRAAEARSELALVEPLARGREPTNYTGAVTLLLAHTHAVLGDAVAAVSWLREIMSAPSASPFTPASLRLDPRFQNIIEKPEMQALLKEFASLDQPAVSAAAPEQKSVAVMAFKNLSSEKDSEYFSDGLSEEILTALSRERDLRVAAPTSSFYFKGKNATVAEIANALNVAQLVEGSVQRSGTRVRIRVQLTRASDGFSEELGEFTEDLSDIFALQDKVARAVVEKLSHRAPASDVAVLTKNSEAYDLYLRGRVLQTRGQQASEDALQYYRQAVKIDPDFALAWERIAETISYNMRSIDTSPERAMAARQAFSRTLELRPELTEALIPKANYEMYVDSDYAAAGRDLQRAETLGAATAELRSTQALLARETNDWEAFSRRAREALELDPENGTNRNTLGLTLLLRGRYREAEEILSRAMAIQGPTLRSPLVNLVNIYLRWRGPETALRFLARVPNEQVPRNKCEVELLVEAGRINEARQRAVTLPVESVWKASETSSGVQYLRVQRLAGEPQAFHRAAEAVLAVARAELARGNRSRYVLQELISSEIDFGIRDSALTDLESWRKEAESWPGVFHRFFDYGIYAPALYARLGKTDEAIAAMREILSGGFQFGYEWRYDPDLASLRGDPRFEELVKRTEAWAAAQPNPTEL